MKKIKLKHLSLLFILFLVSSAYGQNYTWVKGDNDIDKPGRYGILGVPSLTNNPGGREQAITWKDASGNFWLFGGFGFDAAGNWDFLNDLWRYSTLTNEWTWMKGDSLISQAGVYGTQGIGAPANTPGARGAGSGWADGSGNLWLFGGIAYDAFTTSGEINDLWKYNIASNQWTWMSGSNACFQPGVYGTQGVSAPSNIPAARFGTVSWKDASGNFWLFGGIDNTNGDYNDLWRYTPANNQWTWMKGSNTAGQNGVYGTLGVSAPSNNPGSRWMPLGWTDASGNFWMLGGNGLDAVSFFDDVLNDLWRYNVTTNQWTWMKGSNIAAQNGTYGTLNTPALANTPGGRFAGTTWTDASGDLWCMGGNGLDATATFSDFLNDLWRYNIVSNQWTWMKGSNSQLQPGIYGTMGSSNPANTPGARNGHCSWVDNANNLWLFGGNGSDGLGNMGELNELWKISTCIAQPLTILSSNPIICPGVTATLSVSGASTYTWSTLQTGTVINVSPVVTTTYIVNSLNGVGCSNNASFVQSVAANPTVTVVSTNTLVCLGSTATLTAAGATSYSWSTTQNGAAITVTPATLAVFSPTVTGTDANGCKGTAVINLSVVPLPTLLVSSVRPKICKGETSTLTVSGASSYSWHTAAANTTTFASISPTTNTSYTVTGTGTNGCKSIASITQTVDACLGIAEHKDLSVPHKLYPNPNNGEFVLSFQEELDQTTKLLIINALGQIVFEKNINDLENRVSLDLLSGLYHYQVMAADRKIAAGKLVIE